MNQTFDLAGALPSGRTVIEASAGTGKTYSLTGLIVRYIAEADVPVDQFLVVTFTRAAANDLRDRTRRALQVARQVMESELVPDGHQWMAVLLDGAGNTQVHAERLRRLSVALNRFDELTITTIHGFCQQALMQLGIRSGTDPTAVLVENTHELVSEVCRDLIVTGLADAPLLLNSPSGSHTRVRTPTQAEKNLIANVTTAIANPGASLAPQGREITGEAQPRLAGDQVNDAMAARWLEMTTAALQEVNRRQRLRGEIGYDALVTGIRDALIDPVHGVAVADQLAQRTSIVLVDEFQDTDRTQWDVFNIAFARRTLITVGDPKQAIYRFRGADVHAYLDAVDQTPARSLATNYRSDRSLLEGLEQLFRGATLGDSRIPFLPVVARASAPINALGAGAGVHLRSAPLDDQLRAGQRTDLSMPLVRTLVLADLVNRTVDLLDNGTVTDHQGDTRRVQPGDIAILVPSHAEASNVAEAMRRARIPAVRTRTGSVLRTPAASQWRLLLAALSQPHRAPVVRAAALGWFLATDVVVLANSDDTLIELQEHVAVLADRLRLLGISAFYDEQKSISHAHIWGRGVVRTVLGREGGDRHLTDLDHIAELLADALHGQPCDPALVSRTLDGLITGTNDLSEDTMRRIDSDSLAAQITTIHSAKGLEYPIVLVPFAFKQRASIRLPHSYVAPDGKRALDVASTVGWERAQSVPGDETSRYIQLARREWSNLETEGDELRLLYVALTRAAHRVEIWWANTRGANGSALGRILLDRDGGGPIQNTPTEFRPHLTKTGVGKKFDVGTPAHHGLSEALVLNQLRTLASASDGALQLTELAPRILPMVWAGGGVTQSVPMRPATSPNRTSVLDHAWRRWSFSALGAHVERDLRPGEVTHLSWEPSLPAAGDERGGFDEPVELDTAIATDTAVATATATDTATDTTAGAAQGFGESGQLSLFSASADPDTTRIESDVPLVAAMADVGGGTRFGTFVHAVLEELVVDVSADLSGQLRTLVVDHARRAGLHVATVDGQPNRPLVDPVVDGLLAALHTPLGPLFSGRSLAQISGGDRLAELTFDLALLRGVSTRAPLSAGVIGSILLDTLGDDDPLRPFGAQLASEMAALEISGWMHGSIDAIVRIPADAASAGATGHAHRYLVIDYKTNRLHEPGAVDPVAAYRPDRLVPAMIHSRYPLQALLYTVALHRYLRWRLGSAYSPEHHLGGIGYLFLRGMVGPKTPTFDGVPHGVFSWRPPTATVLAIDQYFAIGDRGGQKRSGQS